jgi:hypothetical protein
LAPATTDNSELPDQQLFAQELRVRGHVLFHRALQGRGVHKLALRVEQFQFLLELRVIEHLLNCRLPLRHHRIRDTDSEGKAAPEMRGYPVAPFSTKVGTSGNNLLREDFLRHESLSWLSLLIPDLSKAAGAPDRLGSSLELEQRFEDFLTGAMPMGLHHALCRIDAGCPHRSHDRGVFLD